MKKELPKIYSPADYESDIYHIWESSGFFNPDKLATGLGEPYAIMMPPPNVTGVLHLGHAMENALMDLQIRYQRMLGKKTLLLPGTDHAAVATQARVEKELIASGKYKDPRTELGREKLLQIIKDYADKSRETILKQIRIMGTSCDWSRLAYTFDEQRSAAVNEMFIRMYNDGLIYRGHRIVNWDPKLQTTVSDDELVWQEENIPLYYFHFGPFIITTARPETKLGDKYVVVHPDDKRYWKYKDGDTFDCEWINGPVKATVIKDKVIDPEFGTGAMTITPWHDAVDFDIAERHKLDKVQIIGFDGKMLPIAGEFAGLSISEARAMIVQKLEKKGLIFDVKKDYIHRVAISDRGGVPVEPQIKLQWFVDVNKPIPKKGKSLKDLMREAVTTGHGGKKENIITIQPERFAKSYLQWIDNLHDWCISRQIWWGHRIPVWYRNQGPVTGNRGTKSSTPITDYRLPGTTDLDNEIHVGTDAPPGTGWTQDEDTLDTWFSSGTWTFSTLGWPKETPDLKQYHPTAWMQMGYELLFFWMARMIMMSTYALDQIPFREVYFHGILRDTDGKKFSKSLGNGIDPMDICRQYGTDSLRLSLIAGISPGSDSKFYTEKIQGYRNFINKLWNISRFILTSVEEPKLIDEPPVLTSEIDYWIWHEYTGLVKEVTNLLNDKMFSLAAEKLYDFTWSKFADWYLELAKIENRIKPETKKDRGDLLVYLLQNLLKLWHPFIPFVTEVIWQQLDSEKLLMINRWPEEEILTSEEKREYQSVEEVKKIQEIVTVLRNARAENKVTPATISQVQYIGQQKIDAIKPFIETLGRVKLVDQVESKLELKGSWFRLITDIQGVEKGVDQTELKKYIADLEAKLADKNFASRAPQSVVEEVKRKLTEARAKLL